MRQMNNTAMAKSLLAATLMALATHLLSTSLARGDEAAPASEPVIVTLRAQATAVQGRVTLGDLCTLEGLPEAFAGRTITLTDGVVSMSDIVRHLTEAGVREDRLHVQGPIACKVTFIAGEQIEIGDESAGEWSDLAAPQSNEDTAADMALSQRLRDDLASRLGLPIDTIDLSFRGSDAALAARRDVVVFGSQRADDLGSVSWFIRVDGKDETIRADAEATVTRPTVVRPIARGQTIRPEDLELRPSRIRRLAERGISLDEAVGQRAARNLDVGTALEPGQLQPTLLVKRGQRLTIVTGHGGISISLIAQSQGDATFGQSVRARVDSTGEMLSVRIVGPQLGTVDQ